MFRPSMNTRRTLVVTAAVLALGAPAVPTADATTGNVTKRSYANGYSALVYTPAGLSTRRPVPLFVMVHGCNTTADQQMGATQLNVLADREKFVVLYPDHEGDRTSTPSAAGGSGRTRSARAATPRPPPPTKFYELRAKPLAVDNCDTALARIVHEAAAAPMVGAADLSA
jgi:poly(3-hydroxybutyrate) depolymerase